MKTYQDITISKPNIKRAFVRKSSLYSVYKDLRNVSRLNVIGDYPLLHFIIKELKDYGRNVTKNEVLRVLRRTHDKEFQRVRQDSKILSQICA